MSAIAATLTAVAPIQQSGAPMDIVIIGLTITSSWGNGHATTYRGLVRELERRGHRVLFLEHDKPWYAANRDMPNPPFGRTHLYQSVGDLRRRFGAEIRHADVVMVGSYVPQGIEVGEYVTSTARGVSAFYDIDTPVTLASLRRNACEYLTRQLIPRYRLYLSFTGGPTLRSLECELGSPAARALYCSVDPTIYHPERRHVRWDMGYLGTFSADRQPALEELLLRPAQWLPHSRFIVAGPQYPDEISWPSNVRRIEHLPPADHCAFYNAQRFTLNLTRTDMRKAGYSPSVRLFEAAACGVPIISDHWAGLEELFEPGRDILVAHDGETITEYLTDMSQPERLAIGLRARHCILAAHTAAHRAAELEQYVLSVT